MGSTLNGYGKPTFNDSYDFPEDTNTLATFADMFANVRRGTASARTGLLAGQIRDGMLFLETDTGLIWEYTTADGWRCMTGAMLSVATDNSQSIANSTNTDVTFTGETPIIIGHGLAVNVSTGVVTATLAGKYRVHGQAAWNAGGSVAAHVLTISKNNATTGLGSALATVDVVNTICGQAVTGMFDLAANDTIRLKALQTSGGAKNLFVSGLAYYTSLIVERVAG